MVSFKLKEFGLNFMKIIFKFKQELSQMGKKKMGLIAQDF